ncbi:MAG: phosphoglycolate phosphatase, partial [Acidiferrobacteraceae bacterium]
MGSASLSANAAFQLPLTVGMVLVDLDGTLIHTAPDLAASANRMLEALGMATHDQARVETWIGNGVSRLVKRALTGDMDAEPEAELYDRAYPLFLQFYGEQVADRSRPYPGVIEGLEALKTAGFGLACITNKAEEFTVPLLKALQLDGYFSLVLSGDSLAKKKPDPLPLLHACEHFGVTPEHAVLVGDSVNDTQAARNAGMPVILVSYGYNRGQDVR